MHIMATEKSLMRMAGNMTIQGKKETRGDLVLPEKVAAVDPPIEELSTTET